MGTLSFAAVLVVALYLLAFTGASRLAAETAGASVWLFEQARGRDRLAAMGFRTAFVLAVLGPLLLAVFPALAALDALWGRGGGTASAMAGLLVAVAGAMLAWGAQVAMGASWRVGVPGEGSEGAVGALVTEGLFRISRNPTFAGQLGLFAGVALAVPSLATLAALLLFWLSARTQIASEESALLARHGAAF